MYFCVVAAFNADTARLRREAGFPPRVSRTVRTAADWNRALEQVRQLGFAVSHSESFEESSSVAVPVLRRGVSVAAVSVFGPTPAIAPRVDRLVPLLIAATRRIARGT